MKKILCYARMAETEDIQNEYCMYTVRKHTHPYVESSEVSCVM